MSDEKKNVLSLVQKKPKDPYEEERNIKRDELFARITAGESYVLIVVNEQGKTEFVTDFDPPSAVYEMEKVKVSLVLGDTSFDDDDE